jgi:hypothetical protein
MSLLEDEVDHLSDLIGSRHGERVCLVIEREKGSVYRQCPVRAMELLLALDAFSFRRGREKKREKTFGRVGLFGEEFGTNEPRCRESFETTVHW